MTEPQTRAWNPNWVIRAWVMAIVGMVLFAAVRFFLSMGAGAGTQGPGALFGMPFIVIGGFGGFCVVRAIAISKMRLLTFCAVALPLFAHLAMLYLGFLTVAPQ